MAGFREGRRRLPQSEPRSRTLPLPATASPASRGRPRGTRVQFARLGRGAAEALVAVHAPARLASVAALAGARAFTLTSVGANRPRRPKNTEHASPRRSHVSFPKKAIA